MKRFPVIFFVLLLLGGCGSSSSSGPSFTSGSTYDGSAPHTVSTLAGTAGVVDSLDGIGAAARFRQPTGVAVSPDGTVLYVTDFTDDTVRKVIVASGAVTTVAGKTGVVGAADGIGVAASFNGPDNIATDGINLYLTDFNNNKIRKIEIATGAVTTLAGAGASGSLDGAGTAATFNGPTGIAISPDATTLFVTDFNSNAIREIVIASGAVTTVVTNANLGSPAGIATDGTNLYVCGFGSNVISQVVIATGAISTLAGSTSSAGSADGTGTAANFANPNGIALLGGNLYVTDSYDDLVRKIVISSGVVTTVAGTARTAGSANGVGAAAGLNYPIGISANGTNGTRLFIGDAGNSIVREIQ